jgi:hydroxylamine dehydrogenase
MHRPLKYYTARHCCNQKTLLPFERGDTWGGKKTFSKKKFCNTVKALLKYFTILIFFAELFLLSSCTTQEKTTIPPQTTVITPRKETVSIAKGEDTATIITEKKGLTEESLKCITCHEERKVTHGWVADWQGSKHARNGVGCEACHISPDAELAVKESVELEYLGTGGSSCADTRVHRNVIAASCGKCHRKEYEEFMKSRHSIGWQRMLECGRLMALPKDTRSEKCEQCHNIQFKCDSCHTRHTFNTIEAKTPEACRTCHMGPDHPHYEAYISSKHGSVYMTGQSTILKESQSVQSLRSPVCVTCHMPKGTHDISFGLTRGPLGSGLHYIDRNGATIDEVEFTKKREEMLSVCNTCHSLRFARKTLMMADDIYMNTETVIKEAKDIVSGLEREKVLFPSAGEMVKIPLPGHAFVQGNLQSYTNKSRIERLFIKLTYSAAVTWKGAYHENPGYTHLYGWTKLQEDLSDIKEEVKKLREEAELRRKMKIKLR